LLLPSLPDEKRQVFFWNEQAILRIGNCPVVLGMNQYIVIPAQIDNRPGWNSTASEESDLEWLKRKRIAGAENTQLVVSGALDCQARCPEDPIFISHIACGIWL
jgi:hypothetical protein